MNVDRQYPLALDGDPEREAIEAVHAATALYTAEPVVDQLLDLLQWPANGGSLLDPSCGNGMFLVRALERVLAMAPAASDEALLQLTGWEFHPPAAAEARQRVETRLILAGRSAGDAQRLAARMVVCADFLTAGPDSPSVNFIAGNPPYLRRLRVPSLLQRQYDAVVPGHARADLLHAFLDRCVRCLKPGGRIGLVTADRWLAAAQGAALRAEMGRYVAIAHLQRLDARSTFFRSKTRVAGTPPRVHPVALLLAGAGEPGCQPLSAAPIYPGVDAARYRDRPTLGERASVRLAPWLGTDGVFLVDAGAAAALPADLLVPVLAPEDLAGEAVQPPRRWAIRTVPGELPAPSIRLHLQRTLPAMSARGRQAGAWQPPESFHRWDLSRPMLVLPRILARVAPIWLPAGRLPISHQLAIQCDDVAQLRQLADALRQPLATEWLHGHAPRLENGYHQLSAPLLRRMPLAIDG
ncbi:N-6 DNA methylase [Chromobacterium haemolyticum]|uniref:site-specific DNA-methyltransferase (adenine-specific) n=1 Tax=Chromobacterium fluminis TaxID=3044269 RepID=A0ABX0LD00_9NEIS|nr:N-6 DNA methylase [Chromobacterium haemolyticum]NHR07409.1 N-6 DNA methylase [Chromobacterium haemolyticum]